MVRNLFFKSDGTYEIVYLTETERCLLSLISYLQDKEHGLGNTEDFGNIMMNNYDAKVITDLLKKVNNDLKAISYYKKLKNF